MSARFQTGRFPGNGAGDIYTRGYTYKADQVVQEDTCLLGATASHTVAYGYDRALRLVSASSPTFATNGGTIGTRAYGYDGRGNRTSESREDCGYALAYGSAGQPDQLTSQSSSCAGALLGYSYAYDQDGRLQSKSWPVDSSGLSGTVLTLASAVQGAGSNSGLETVYKSISVNGALYGYFYDAFNRRRLKTYPAGPMDEYFHDTANQLLVDQGNDSVTAASSLPVDEYVWLSGRPVVLIRSKLSTGYVRQADGTGDCTRNGESASCGVYFPVTDPLGKPVLMLDASRQVTGVAEYDTFGFPNRVSLNTETAHPYANNATATLADFIQPLGGTANPGTQVRVRVLFDVVDTEGPSGSPADYVFLADPDGGVALTSNIGRPHRGQVWSPWVQPSAGRVQTRFVSNATGNTYTGVVMAGYEYQRFQTGAQPFWTPLRFPGQYYDSETDLVQNWNRFYDPASGRYLESEPLLMLPRRATVYSYAGSNPITRYDPTGLYIRVLATYLPVTYGWAPPGKVGYTDISIWEPNPGPCVCKDGSCKFDVDVRYSIQQGYQTKATRSAPSGDCSTLGMTVGGHEAVHFMHAVQALSEDDLNASMQSEGFHDHCSCDNGREKFKKAFLARVNRLMATEQSLDDECPLIISLP